MHILIVSHLFNDGLPELGLASIPHTYLGSLEQTGLATYETFYLDQHYAQHGNIGEDALLAHIERQPPDIVLCTWLFSKPFLNLHAKFFQTLKERLKIPVVLSVHDNIHTREVQMCEVLMPFLDLAYGLDGTDKYKALMGDKSKFISTFMPLDTRRFLKGPYERTIDVSFLGRVYNERITFLNHLHQNGVAVVVGGWAGEAEKVPLDLYAETMLRSKMTINTSLTSLGGTLKWRAMEATLCGCLLLEFADETTKHFFEPFKEYVPFENEHDLLDKVRYYLAAPEECQRIAANGRERAWSQYTGEIWWRGMFDRLRSDGVLK